jgi:hypothetical protein
MAPATCAELETRHGRSGGSSNNGLGAARPPDVYWCGGGGGGGDDAEGTQTHCHGWRTPSP